MTPKKQTGMERAKSRPKRINRTKQFNRLTTEQFKKMMKQATEELGLNDKKAAPILDTTTPAPLKDINDIIDRVTVNLASSEIEASDIVEQFEELTHGRRFKKKDKLNILGWLLSPHSKKPMCLIDKRERVKKPRNIGLKKKGDIGILNRPMRELPDEQYLREIDSSKNRKRTKFDAFDKLHLDTKIEWARHATSIIGDQTGYRMSKLTNYPTMLFDSEQDAIQIAMKYACKMCGISTFRGNYAKPYWIIHRINKFNEAMTTKEFETFYKVSCDYLGITKKSIRTINSDDAIAKLIPTLKNMGLYEEYKEWYKKETAKTVKLRNANSIEHNCLKKATDLIRGKNV